jgi:hypothetical protein
MLTIAIAVLAGILLVHLLKDVVKAAILVVVFLCVVYAARGVTFEALVDEGAHELYDGACRPHHTAGFRL